MNGSAQTSAVHVEGLHKQYGLIKRTKVLDAVNLQVQRGDIFALIGPNGAGKTTLMGCMLALLRPNAGSVQIFGKPADHLSVRSVTGFLPERPSFEAWMSARDFVGYHLLLSGRKPVNAKKEIDEALELVGLQDVASRKLAKFSRGMLQRVGLAQVLIGNPEIVFLDEPTSGMDPPGMELVRQLLIRFKEKGVTVVVNSHHLDEVARVCNRFAFMRKGKIEIHDDVDKVNSRVLVARFPRDYTAPPMAELETILEPLNVGVKDCTTEECKLVLPHREQASLVIKELTYGGIVFEEIFFERSNLSDLFKPELTEPNGGTASTNGGAVDE